MDFRELNDNLTKFLPTTNPMLEFADSRFCGIELTDDICAGDIQTKVNWMVDYIEKHAPKDKFIGYKISNIRTFQRNDYYTNESKSYGITITMGETDVNNYVKSTTGFGLYHLKFKRDSYFHNKNHWNISKRMLRNISGLLENPIESYYDNKGVFIPSKVKILDNKNQYIIGLGGYGNIYDDATILVTCF